MSNETGKTEEIREEFASYMLTDAGLEKAKLIAKAFTQLIMRLEELCPEGRSLSLCRTRLEEANYHAKRAMARLEGNHE